VEVAVIATTLRMTWANIAFLHWPMPADALRAKLPSGLELDTHEGTAWLGITPFEMRDVHVAGGPRFPTAVDFPELNVRTYVTRNRHPGVFFFSLDAASLLAVIGARATTGLPYFHARMSSRPAGQEI
jgi:uncharacterized protein